MQWCRRVRSSARRSASRQVSSASGSSPSSSSASRRSSSSSPSARPWYDHRRHCRSLAALNRLGCRAIRAGGNRIGGAGWRSACPLAGAHGPRRGASAERYRFAQRADFHLATATPKLLPPITCGLHAPARLMRARDQFVSHDFHENLVGGAIFPRRASRARSQWRSHLNGERAGEMICRSERSAATVSPGLISDTMMQTDRTPESRLRAAEGGGGDPLFPVAVSFFLSRGAPRAHFDLLVYFRPPERLPFEFPVAAHERNAGATRFSTYTSKSFLASSSGWNTQGTGPALASVRCVKVNSGAVLSISQR